MSESVRLIYSNGHELARPMMESDVSKNAIILATMDYQSRAAVKVTIKLGLIDSMTNGLPHWGWCFPGLQPGDRSIVGPSALRFSPYACLALAYISSITSPPRPPTNWMSSTPVSSGSSAKDPSATGYQGGMQEMDFGGTRSGD
ncbi:hypothetical protein ASPNIDRAFT_40148 [Aspergillus niger ATCC 1015]|uniref:Uncharacterized protein n=1 Tax=Aspergillus niger (strain ATCC 1015 / CBS 113.46 / FGSC A1144 / LSHB Ac4 / NCTC 3858a / NRRL 328 / USDA 3528.7) TaxID=380704 RepID=G3Y082_ASPNA|nr:hypothetical protein ASPNIDRAFT_40148 [Aspergillus niger ATCC 1015]